MYLNFGEENGESFVHNSRFLHGLHDVCMRNIEGDFFDLGAWNGTKSFIAAKYFKDNNILNKRVYLFDTFEGHVKDQITEVDKKWGFINKLNHFSTFNHDHIDSIKKRFKEIEFDNYELVKGNILETLKDFKDKKVCFASTDLNFYIPTKASFSYLKDNLAEGGLIFEDDYLNIEGITKCVDEFKHLLKTKEIDGLKFFYFK